MESFAQSSSDGNVFIANGIEQVLVWDGLSSTAAPAGVVAPVGALDLSASGAGSITGTYYGWVRFVNSRGQFSNLSPISAPASASANGQIDYINVPVPFFMNDVVGRQIIRNTNGSVGSVDPLTGETRNIAYVDIDTTDIVSTTFTSTRTDPDLSTQESVDIDQAAIENGVPPSYKPFLIWHQNRMYLLGIEPYQRGSCSVTLGSQIVQGYNTKWKETFVGRILYVTGAPKNYTITSVNETTQQIFLSEVYGGTSNPWGEYSVRPVPAEANAFQFSEPDKPEAWNPVNVLVLPEDGDRVVGAFNYGSYLYIVKTRHLYRFICRSDPANDGRIFLAASIGCVNNRSWAIVDETCYMMDTGGIHAFRGDDQGELISTPIQDMFNNQPGTGKKINWAAGRYFHACHSPNEEVVRWFVALAGDYVPRDMICFAYKLGKIWTESLPFRAASSVLSRIGGRVGTVAEGIEQYYVGSTGGRVYAPLGAAIDGSPQGGTIRGSVTSADDVSITDANARFAAGCVNSPVSITEGKGRGQSAYVVERTTTRLVINTPWRVRPDETSRYCLGGIVWTYSSQRLRWVPGEADMARSVEMEFQPNRVPNKARVGFAPDFSDPVKMAWDIDRGFRTDVQAKIGDQGQDILLDSVDGYTLVQQNSWREGSVAGAMGRTARLVMSGVSNEEQVQIGSVLVNGANG
jgi:hypothetical protein